MNIIEARANIAAATTLIELLVALRETNDLTDEEQDAIDWTDLPTFGGQEPIETMGVWS